VKWGKIDTHTQISRRARKTYHLKKTSYDSKHNFIFSERKNFLATFVVLLFQRTIVLERILDPHEY